MGTISGMSCRRKGGLTGTVSHAADVDDRELSAAARDRAAKKSAHAQRPAASATPPVPWVPFIVALAFLLFVGYLTVRYS